MVSAPLPRTHSPAAAPEALSEFAARIASRRVHTPSLATTSLVSLTLMVAAWAAALTTRQRPANPASAALRRGNEIKKLIE